MFIPFYVGFCLFVLFCLFCFAWHIFVGPRLSTLSYNTKQTTIAKIIQRETSKQTATIPHPPPHSPHAPPPPPQKKKIILFYLKPSSDWSHSCPHHFLYIHFFWGVFVCFCCFAMAMTTVIYMKVLCTHLHYGQTVSESFKWDMMLYDCTIVWSNVLAKNNHHCPPAPPPPPPRKATTPHPIPPALPPSPPNKQTNKQKPS